MARGRNAWLAAAAAVLAVAGPACSGGDGGSGAGASSTTSGAATVTLPAPATTTATLPPNGSRLAQANVAELPVYDQPDAPAPSRTFPNPWYVNDDHRYPVPQVFLVESVRPDGWVQVLLPVRPNGSIGWVRGSDVQLAVNTYRVVVSLSAHQITVYDGAAVFYQGPVATGAPATPTPTGHYFIRVLQQAPDPNTVYGPYAYGLSSNSDVLTDFNGGDGEIGIHGNNDASALGRSVSHGCIRMDNTAITNLTKVLPLGTPVDIDP
ncbi:MAG TPA: L,D-transpeptidase [Acidimicrobiia bacterium]|nr:L,D-transpeptidase [Acidimicrobiia bacterium]